jgi:hypothetical protein
MYHLSLGVVKSTDCCHYSNNAVDGLIVSPGGITMHCKRLTKRAVLTLLDHLGFQMLCGYRSV